MDCIASFFEWLAGLTLSHEITDWFQGVGGIFAAVAAFLSHRQMKLTERLAQASLVENRKLATTMAEESLARARRDVSLNQGDRFQDRLLPRYGELINGLRKHYTMDRLRNSPTEMKAALRLAFNARANEVVNGTLNEFEVFAVHITSGAAEEQLSFDLCGKAYCETMNDLIPIALSIHPRARVTGTDQYKLYQQWSARLNANASDSDTVPPHPPDVSLTQP